jgi:hypothetical protein
MRIRRSTVTFTSIPAGTTQWDVALNAALQDLQDQITGMGFRPADHNLKAWTFDPAIAQSAAAPAAGVLHLGKIKLGTASSVTNIIATVTATGSGLTSGQNFAGLYNSSGTLIATTADQTSSWGSATAAKTMALTGGPYTLAAGTYYGALLANGTTPPSFLTGHATSQSTLNIGLTTGRYLTSGSGLTTLPSSVTLASGTLSNRGWWFALS